MSVVRFEVVLLEASLRPLTSWSCIYHWVPVSWHINDVLCMQRENGNGTKILGKSDISKETKTNEGKGRNTCGLSGGMHICVYGCMVTHIARVWINRVRLPILHVVGWTGKMNISLSAFAPENLVSRDGFDSPAPRQSAHLHTQAESLLTGFLPISTAASIYLLSRVWINRVMLPILLVVSWTGKRNISLSPFAPETLTSRDGFGSPVPRQPTHLHTQA